MHVVKIHVIKKAAHDLYQAGVTRYVSDSLSHSKLASQAEYHQPHKDQFSTQMSSQILP